MLVIFLKNVFSLPIENLSKEINETIELKNIIIVYGETGSGKSTKLPQLLYQSKLFNQKKIVITQPRRMATVSLALRVSKEMTDKVGNLVGYSIRFEDCTSKNTIIKYCTEGILLKECYEDFLLSFYGILIIDEAHERTLNTDLLLGLVKKIIEKRNEFRIVITSATIDITKFSLFFNKCPIFLIPGRSFDVKIMYLPKNIVDYIKVMIKTIIKIVFYNISGNILAFLTGKCEIDSIIISLENLKERNIKKLISVNFLPLYSNLNIESQAKIFNSISNKIKNVILSTNIAETSLTIPGIVYVVDSGYQKCKLFNPSTMIESLAIIPISKSSADQRAGRAGRVLQGYCFRLFSEKTYMQELNKTNIPEIIRLNLISAILALKALKVSDIMSFDFIDKPDINVVSVSLEELYNLEALTKTGKLTKLGKIMSCFPFEPKTSKTLLQSFNYKCFIEVSLIIGIFSSSLNIFFNKYYNLNNSNPSEYISYFKKYISRNGDLLTYLNIYKEWVLNNYSSIWAKNNCINQSVLLHSKKTCRQLISIMKKLKLIIIQFKRDDKKIIKSFLSGFFLNLSKQVKKYEYIILKSQRDVFLHPKSFSRINPSKWVIFESLIYTNKLYISNVCTISPEWINIQRN